MERVDLQLRQSVHLAVDSIGRGQQRHQVVENAVALLGVGDVGGADEASVDATQSEGVEPVDGVVGPLVGRGLGFDGELGDPVGPDGAFQLGDAVDVVQRGRRGRLAEHDAV